MVKRVMQQLHLKRIAAVDRPCQEGAKAAIIKRAQDAVPAEVEAYLKRALAPEAAASGAALPDGSFAIKTRADLKAAVQAAPHAKDVAKAVAHVTTVARAMDATSLLPATWKSGSPELLALTNQESVDGLGAVVKAFLDDLTDAGLAVDKADAVAREYANVLVLEIDKAVCALRDVAAEIDADAAIVDKAEALQESAGQFTAHIKGITSDGLENAVVAAALSKAGFEINEGGALTKRETSMGFDLKKFLNLPATATDAEVEKAAGTLQGGASFALNVLKMSSDHLAYMAKAEKLQTETAKQEFAALTAEKRAEVIKAFPLPKPKKKGPNGEDCDDDADMDKRAKDEVIKVAGVEIKKSVVGESAFAVMKQQQEDIAKLQDKDATVVIAKRLEPLKNIGKADDVATLLHSIEKHDPKLAKAVEDKITQMDAAIAKGALFTEVGKSTTGTSFGKAAAAIEAKAQEILDKGQAKSIHKARDMARQQNPELKKQEEAERSDKKAA